MAFSPPIYCRLFAQKKAYQGAGGGGVTGTPGPSPSYAPDILFNSTEVGFSKVSNQASKKGGMEGRK